MVPKGKYRGHAANRNRVVQDGRCRSSRIAAKTDGAEAGSEEITVGALAGHIAHEINNPLAYLNNYLYLLSESLPADFTAKGYLNKIEQGVNNLTSLSHDLMELSRTGDDAFGPQEIHGVLDSAIENMKQHLQRGSVTIRKNYHSGDCMVVCSREMLGQVFQNVIQNALDAMEPGKGTLSISTSSRNGFVVLKFTDNGCGISDENMRKVLTLPFTTKKSTDKRGTGLGLVICYNFMKRHRGTIHVSSSDGDGTSVTIIVPAVSP